MPAVAKKTKYLKKDKEKFLAAYARQMGNASKACKQCNISRTVFYRWKQEEWFRQAIEDVEEGLIDMAESALYQLIKEGNTTAIIFYLKTKGRKRGYIEKKEIEFEDKTKEKQVFEIGGTIIEFN